MSVKTTKETCNQDITFKGNAYVEGSFIVPTFYDIYAKIDDEPYSLGDYMNGTYVPINGIITMTPKTITEGNNMLLGLGTELHSTSYYQFSIYNNENGIYFCATNRHYTGKSLKFNFGYTSNPSRWSLDANNNILAYYTGLASSDSNKTSVKLSANYKGRTVTMAFIEDINAVASLALTNTTGHQYTGTIASDKKVELIIDINASYTASVNIAKGLRTAFQMCYGTTSDDVAVCFASMDSNGLVTIDLDNVQLSSITPACSYVIYN